MREQKLPKGNGHLITWARKTRRPEIRQLELARLILTHEGAEQTDEVVVSLHWLIKNCETNRQMLPVSLLRRIGDALSLGLDWWTRVPRLSSAADSSELTSNGSRVLEIPIAPIDRSIPLRTSYVINRKAWNRKAEWPEYLTIPEYRPESEPAFPILFADVVQEGDEDVCPGIVKPGDTFVVRTDLEPVIPKLILATSKTGKPLRRQLVQVNDAWVLRHFRMAVPDISLLDVASIDGVIVGRLRRLREKGVNAIHESSGLELEDL